MLDNFFHDSMTFVTFIRLIKYKIESVFLTFHNFYIKLENIFE